ncbi:MAG: DsbA family protein [Gammaproteobacteria bacterium]|nr:DsbA family protein [Gammaproteobacteria bacterium]NNC55941.1 thioredoxin domain-containing protein [Woeseiaceae bacterium]
MNFRSLKYQAGRLHWAIPIGAIVVVILIAITAWVVIQDEEDAKGAQSADDARAAALASEHAPTTGDPNAPVHIVEFLDPACETCAVFYPLVKQWLQEVPGKLRLSVRHVPFHRGSEYAVQVLEASREQGLYWETLEALLATQGQWTQNHTVVPERIAPAIASVGLNMDRLKTDMNNFDVKLRMEHDRKDAVSLMVRATPQYFVNGRELKNFGYEQLAALVRDELSKAESTQ